MRTQAFPLKCTSWVRETHRIYVCPTVAIALNYWEIISLKDHWSVKELFTKNLNLSSITPCCKQHPDNRYDSHHAKSAFSHGTGLLQTTGHITRDADLGQSKGVRMKAHAKAQRSRTGKLRN